MLNPLASAWQCFGRGSCSLSRIDLILMVLGVFQMKHFICDGPLQTLAMVQAKSHYGRPLGLVHAAVHGVGTFLVFLIAGAPSALILALIDGLVHYHADFAKENLVKYFEWRTNDSPFWWALSADQAFHQLTYIGLVWWAFKP